MDENENAPLPVVQMAIDKEESDERAGRAYSNPATTSKTSRQYPEVGDGITEPMGRL